MCIHTYIVGCVRVCVLMRACVCGYVLVQAGLCACVVCVRVYARACVDAHVCSMGMHVIAYAPCVAVNADSFLTL